MHELMGLSGHEADGEDQYILDTQPVRDLIAHTREVVARAASPEEACDQIRPHFARLLADDSWLPSEYQADAPESGMGGGIGQWLLFRAGDGSLSLFSLVVPPEAETPVHDHLAWGLVGLYAGTQDEEVFGYQGETLGVHRAAVPVAGRLLPAAAAARRHPPRADDLGQDVGLDPPAVKRHRVRVAPPLRAGHERGQAVPVGYVNVPARNARPPGSARTPG